MRATITDPGTKIILQHQLEKGKVTCMELFPVKDFQVQEHQLAVFTAMLSTQEGAILNAWVLTVMGHSSYYNQENYPTPDDAVAQHLGKLVLEGKLSIVDVADDGSDDTPANPPPPGFRTL